MCFGSAPRIIAAPAPAPAEVLHNPFLDDENSTNRMIQSLRTGRSALRIKLPGADTIGFGGTRTQAAQRGAVGKISGNASSGQRVSGGRNIGGAIRPMTDAEKLGLTAINTRAAGQEQREEDAADRKEESQFRRDSGD